MVCLEPEGEGSTHGATEVFERRRALLNLDNVVLKPTTLQSFEPDGAPFDIVVSCNSINHLDEAACMTLLDDPASRAVYRELFSKISALSSRGATLIACDCARHNFFGRLGIRNPFVPTIEWDKHQAPEVWADLFGEVGFSNPKIRGRLLIGCGDMAESYSATDQWPTS